MLCFRKFPLAKKVKDRRGVIRSFHRQNFCLTMPKTSAGEPFCALCLRKIAVTKTIMDKRAGGIKIFRRFFLSQSAGTFRRGKLLYCVSENFR